MAILPESRSARAVLSAVLIGAGGLMLFMHFRTNAARSKVDAKTFMEALQSSPEFSNDVFGAIPDPKLRGTGKRPAVQPPRFMDHGPDEGEKKP